MEDEPISKPTESRARKDEQSEKSKESKPKASGLAISKSPLADPQHYSKGDTGLKSSMGPANIRLE